MSKSETPKMAGPRDKKAVALRYNLDEDAAPVVIASGYGTIAESIIDIAEEKGIPVFKDDSAASMLCMLEVGRTIPTELYEVIAAIYMQIMKVSQSIKPDKSAQKDNPAPSEGVNKVAQELRRRMTE